MAKRLRLKGQRVGRQQMLDMGFPPNLYASELAGDPTGEPWEKMPEGRTALAAALRNIN
jgi:hypothetical protein